MTTEKELRIWANTISKEPRAVITANGDQPHSRNE